MTTAHSRRLARCLVLAGIFAALTLGLLTAGAERRALAAKARQEKKEFPLPPAGQKPELVGAAVCQQCHNETDPKTNPLYKQTLGYQFVRLWENKVWGVHDLHSAAYKNLLTSRAPEVKDGSNKPNPTAQRMEDNLRRYKGENYAVWSDTACLACHASTTKPASEVPPAKWTADSFTGIDGVGCEMCHGHGSLYKDAHQASRISKVGAPPGAVRVVDWREAEPQTKEKWGLVDLRDSAVATTQCASCHVGNMKEGRFVTHDMYAAGHPPLPPLDLVAFTREQPRHWGLPSELPYFQWLTEKKPKVAESVFHVHAGESHVARRFAESTIATLRASVNLGGQLAATAKAEGLDFAAFDCASCHHDLKYPSDRQARGYAGRPGRPLFRPAAFALANVVVDHAARTSGGAGLKDSLRLLKAAEKNFFDAFAQKSLGDPEKIVAASAELTKWCDDTLKQLAAVKYTPEETKKLLAKVVEATQQPIADPEVAQLLTWACETLVLDLIPPGADKKPPAATTELRKKLDETVVTRLRPHAAFHYEVGAGEPGPTQEPVDRRIGKRMQIFNSFQGAVFRKAFQEVTPMLARP